MFVYIYIYMYIYVYICIFMYICVCIYIQLTLYLIDYDKISAGMDVKLSQFVPWNTHYIFPNYSSFKSKINFDTFTRYVCIQMYILLLQNCDDSFQFNKFGCMSQNTCCTLNSCLFWHYKSIKNNYNRVM